MYYSQSIGNVVELKCIAKFIEMGYECSIPYGNGAKYDFIADINGELLRFQCKTCSHPKKNGIEDVNAIEFSTTCQTTNTQKTTRHRYTKEQIDYFATAFNDKIYIVPVEECSTSKTLRFVPPNGNSPYNKAEDYEISNFFPVSKEIQDNLNPSANIITVKNYCTKCKKEIPVSSTTGLCRECFIFSLRKVERPSREELKNMIRTMPFTQIGEQFGVSDNAIRKWCKQESLPSRVTDIKQINDGEWEKI